MTCHRCPHNTEIARLREICSKCRLGEGLAGDRSISLDAILDSTESRILDVAPNVETVYTFDPGEIDEPKREKVNCATRFSEETEEALKRLLYSFAALSPEVLKILHGLLNGLTLAEIARREGISKQLMQYRYKKALKIAPWLAVLRGGRDTGGKLGCNAKDNTKESGRTQKDAPTAPHNVETP